MLSRDKTATPPSAAGSERSQKGLNGEDESGDESDASSKAGGDGDTNTAERLAARGADKGKGDAQQQDTDDDEYFERLYRAKKLARSEITVRQWDRYRFCDIDLDEALGPVEDNCERISCHAVSPEEFRERFEVPCKPCVISGLLDRWPAYHKWTYESLKERFGSVRLKCGEDDDGYKVSCPACCARRRNCVRERR
jgi:hypothetical protein